MAPKCAQLSKRHIALVPAMECTSSRAPCRALPFLPPHLAHYTVRSLPWRAHLCSVPSAEAERRSVPSHGEVRSHRPAGPPDEVRKTMSTDPRGPQARSMCLHTRLCRMHGRTNVLSSFRSRRGRSAPEAAPHRNVRGFAGCLHGFVADLSPDRSRAMPRLI